MGNTVELNLSVGRKYNIGNYESKDYFVGTKIQLAPHEIVSKELINNIIIDTLDELEKLIEIKHKGKEMIK